MTVLCDSSDNVAYGGRRSELSNAALHNKYDANSV